MDIEELIRYHHESVFLDFKLEEYSKEKKHELIKDVLSFANANFIGNRFIIFGLKKKAGEIILQDIGNPKDSAEIHQILHSNIEPELDITYSPFFYEGNNFIILTILSPMNPPYLAKKTINSGSGKPMIIEGDCWVRKGDTKARATRKDFDRMYLDRLDNKYFQGDLELTFSDGRSKRQTLCTIGDVILPSVQAKMLIQGQIKLKENALQDAKDPFRLSHVYIHSPFKVKPYEKKTIEELRQDLQNLDKDYYDKDLEFIYETNSRKINICILNNGLEYVEDASIEVRIKKTEGLEIPNKIFKRKGNGYHPGIPYITPTPSFELINYPSVNEINGFYIISEYIGNLKHNMVQHSFKVPFRLFIGNDFKEKVINLECIIFGKNLKEVIKDVLIIDIK